MQKGITLSFVSLLLLGTLPIISNSRPQTLNRLNFSFYLSLWQLVCNFPLLFIEFNQGILDEDVPKNLRNQTICIMLINTRYWLLDVVTKDPVKKMKDITPNISHESSNKACNDDNQSNKEFFLAMQSHFIRNDLQKIIFMLELIKMGNHENSEEKIEKVYQLCERTKKKLETIDRIHRVIHSDFLNPRDCSSLIDLIEETGSQFDFILKINYESINYQIKVDGFFRDLLFELFSFIGNLNVDQVGGEWRKI